MSGKVFWTPERVALLTEHYPTKGKMWCVENLGFTEAQVRQKASRLGLVARGVSDAWKEKQVDHSKKLIGRKRPEQAEVIKDLHRRGVLVMTDETKRILSDGMMQWHSCNEHPRGMAGKKHSAETKESLRKSSTAARLKRTDEQQSSMTDKMLRTKEANGTLVQERPMASWKAGWREIGGIRKYYRSRWEANYARHLEGLRAAGSIARWEHEPETFWFEGILRGCRSYLPDFRVTHNDGSVEYHEVKGWMDERSATKIRRMLKYHPTVTLIVIDAKAYKALSKSCDLVAEGWE